MFRNLSAALAALTLACGLCACSTISGWVTTVETVFSDSDATANALVYCAGEMYAIAATTATTAVEAGAFTSDQLTQLNSYRANIRSALDAMQTAIDAGDDVDAAVFTTAWSAFKSYLSTLGISLTAALSQPAPVAVSANDAQTSLQRARAADAALAGAISQTARAMR